MKKLLMILVIGMPMSSVTVAQETMNASGELVSVRLVTRTFTVRDPQAREVIRYNVPMGTPVTIAGGKARLGHLRSGDRVNVTYRSTDEGREATQVAVPAADPTFDQRVREGLFSTVTGQVAAINFSERTITVVGDQSGERYSYPVPQGARITVGGEQARLGNLRRGDNVVLRFKAEGEQREVARIRVPETTTPVARRPVQTTPPVAAAQQRPSALPKTASPLPFVALAGAFALLGAGALRITRRLRNGG